MTPDYSDPAAPLYSHWAATHKVWNDWYRYSEVEPFADDPDALVALAQDRVLTAHHVDHREPDAAPEIALVYEIVRQGDRDDRRRSANRGYAAKAAARRRAAREARRAEAPLEPAVLQELSETLIAVSDGTDPATNLTPRMGPGYYEIIEVDGRLTVRL